MKFLQLGTFLRPGTTVDRAINSLLRFSRRFLSAITWSRSWDAGLVLLVVVLLHCPNTISSSWIAWNEFLEYWKTGDEELKSPEKPAAISSLHSGLLKKSGLLNERTKGSEALCSIVVLRCFVGLWTSMDAKFAEESLFFKANAGEVELLSEESVSWRPSTNAAIISSVPCSYSSLKIESSISCN